MTTAALLALEDAARAVLATCTRETLNGLLTGLACCDPNPKLTDDQVEAGEALYDALVRLDPTL